MSRLSSHSKRPRGILAVVLFLAGGVALLSPLSAQNAKESGITVTDKGVQAVFERAKDCVVQIKTIVPVTDPASGKAVGERLSAGTGFFVDNQGHILTTASVPGGSKEVVVYWRGKAYTAQCLGQDDRTNLALLKIEATTPSLPAADLETIKPGSTALVVGYPFEGQASLESGFISANGVQMPQLFARSELRSGVPLIRSSVRVHPGQSGSPLLTAKGEMIGMVIYALDDGSSTFVLPIAAAQKIQRDLARYHVPRYGWTGVTVAFNMKDLKNAEREVAVNGVFQGYPGHQAGLQPGDVLKKIGEKTILTPSDLMNATFYLTIGETVNYTIERDGETLTLPVKVIPRPSDEEMLTLKTVAPSTIR